MMAAVLQSKTHVLLCLPGVPTDAEHQLATLKNEFFGNVVDGVPEGGLKAHGYAPEAIVFVAGDVTFLLRHPNGINMTRLARQTNTIDENQVALIKPLCPACVIIPRVFTKVELGQVPRTVHGVGVYYPGLFTANGQGFYDQLHAAHEYQELTESLKPGVSYRKGRYLSRVSTEDNGDLKYHLLRCSTNFQVPTDNFRQVDELIVGKAQAAAHLTFGNTTAELNHVLAQVYHNHNTSPAPESTSTKERKARIKSHSDKTKDMPLHGIMVFCTFYSPDIDQKATISPTGDYMYKNGSVLTKLHWRLKPSVDPAVRERDGLKESFSVLLHPDSLLLMPLSTNRLYMHEIVPPQLPVERIPTRLGYVIRCSKTLAVSTGGKTFVKGTPLVKPTVEQLEELKELYEEENCSTKVVQYRDISFSMNTGDYLPPVL